MHVSHSILLEVPLGSHKHIEDTERNLFDAERQRAFKPLPELHTASSNTRHFFFCSSHAADVKIWMEQSPIRTTVQLKSLRAEVVIVTT